MVKLAFASRKFVDALLTALGRKRRSTRRPKRDPFCRPPLRLSGIWHCSPAASRLYFRRTAKRAKG